MPDLTHHLIKSRALMRLVTRFHILLYRLSQGAVGGLVSGVPNLLLTTTGRRTGRAYTTPLFYYPDGRRMIVVASYAGNPNDPQWWKNLQANGRAQVEVGPHRFEVTAEQASQEVKAEFWPIFCRFYPSYEDYQRRTDRVIPLVVLTPLG